MNATFFFRSKRSVWYTLATLFTIGIFILLLLQDPWFIGLLLLPLIVFMVSIYFRTHYRIHPVNGLTVTCGLFYKKTFDLMSLQSIRPTSNPLSSPALSLKRLELRFRNRETIMISPVKQEEFIELLKSINPEIELKKR
ncbi:PH domain-containing protein [Lentimicrobium sp.]|jgi:hypothetical protein|uniref:PH domain-containing protein n=1 Tax=Lentimicrobium sp. TaxID=2034841 RepID=UPI002D0EEF2E|nr:PH domain-containing protein [Lentimicrobium sp.]MCO5263028.1 PH domain-containing protein [Lentimicrobium sp.]HOP12623.1 PH domain-containing protein [Lentimicrobium sp.]HPF64871.1 PH domain-containing protein [Lentimicrobium sp.]HPJ61959.1 PH domain-containing protein [Lentimicrobium sp.]HPR26208.1 PH domain-containing protein [Lentimicrobium sp.]